MNSRCENYFIKNEQGAFKYAESFSPMDWLHLDIVQFGDSFPYATFPTLNFIRDTIKIQLINALQAGRHGDFYENINEVLDATYGCRADVNGFEDLELQILQIKSAARKQWWMCLGRGSPWYVIDDLILKGFLDAVTPFYTLKQAPMPYFPSSRSIKN